MNKIYIGRFQEVIIFCGCRRQEWLSERDNETWTVDLQWNFKSTKEKMEIGKCIASTMMGFHKYHCLSMELLVGGYRGSKV